ncbi:MAG: AAA family ATPase [Polyangiaceae bacterium]|nr:AAA family ATPase [Polyangiaceae bacterium]
MLLSRLRLLHVGPFEDLTLSFEGGAQRGGPRRLSVLFGGDGVGKSSALAAIAATRPGHAVAQLRHRGDDGPPPAVVADWILGADDPARLHPLRVASPGAKLDEPDDVAALRRREQALFDRRAAEGGHVLVAFSGARWFSRTATVLTTPERSVLRYDVRAPASFDDGTRGDLTREAKQVLAFAPIAAALARGGPAAPDQAARLAALDRALREVLAALLEGAGAAYLGVDPVRLEPVFEVGGARRVDFDDLGRGARHLVAIGALALRALAAAYPAGDPRHAEGVILLDDIELHQPAHRLSELAPRLCAALPGAQWIITTASPAVTLGCAREEVIALRREPASGRVELHAGPDAVLH